MCLCSIECITSRHVFHIVHHTFCMFGTLMLAHSIPYFCLKNMTSTAEFPNLLQVCSTWRLNGLIPFSEIQIQLSRFFIF